MFVYHKIICDFYCRFKLLQIGQSEKIFKFLSARRQPYEMSGRSENMLLCSAVLSWSIMYVATPSDIISAIR